MTEQWRPIPDYEGFYEVSNQGRVRSVDRHTHSYGGRTWLRKGHLLNLSTDKDGYKKAHLSKNGKSRRFFVHRLVAAAFIGPQPAGQECRHLNGNPADNSLANLAWGTQSDNRRDCYQYGGRSGRGKLYREQVLEIRERLAAGEKKTDLAREYGVHFMNIHAIGKGTHFAYIES